MSLSASSLNPRLNFHLVSAVQSQGHELIVVSTKPAAGHRFPFVDDRVEVNLLEVRVAHVEVPGACGELLAVAQRSFRQSNMSRKLGRRLAPASGLVGCATIRWTTGATTLAAGKAVAHGTDQLVIQTPPTPSVTPRLRNVDRPDTISDMRALSRSAKRTDE